MAAKLLHSLSDDNIDLQRQIGCMTGIFQLFDRQQIISARRIGGLSPMRLPSGSSRLYRGNFEDESHSIYHRPTTKEKNSTKNVYEKRVVSGESSRLSFSSSSCSSSFSSLDCNIKISQPDSSPYDRIIFPETPSRDPSMTQPNASPQCARSSLDLRDVVKDSIYRDTWGLSVKTTVNDEVSDRSKKLKESPRPVNSKTREAPWYCDESGGSMYYVSNDAPRFSCDSRETIRSAIKHKELPRLSLDSREGSMRSFNSDNKAAGPSVVARLMGLETLPDAHVAIDNLQRDDREHFLRSSKSTVVPVPNFVKNSWKEPVSPCRRSADMSMKPVSSSRFPIEPAPWKYHDGFQKPSLRNVKTPLKPNNVSIPSVYSEIEKRLKDIEFTQSGKDLRALKQILEAMQAKGILDDSSRQEGQDGNFTTQQATFSKSQMNARFVNKERAFESPIVIMKPAKLVPKSSISSSSMIPMNRLSSFHNSQGDVYLNKRKTSASTRVSKEQVPKTKNRDYGATISRPSKSGQSSIRMQNLSRENVKSPASVSPRLQQKKMELEKRSRPPISPDSNKTRRQPIKNQTESSSPKRRPKIVKKQPNDDQLSEVSSESKGLSYEDDDLEVTSSLSENNASRSPSLKAAKYAASGLAQQRFVPKLIEEGGLVEFGSVAPEQPSPVSILDNTIYAYDSLSPVKRRLDLKDESTVKDNLNREAQNMPVELVSNTNINRKKLENIENLVKKLRRLNSTHDETHTDYIASLCENTQPDDRYISEILLASGLLLRDLNSSLSIFQLHPSGYPINPELFLVLEQTKATTLAKEKIVRAKCEKEKFHRKMIFDAVNEILLKKLTLMWANNSKLARRSLSAQKLLRDLCSEIENLQKTKTSFVLEEEDEDDNLKSIVCEDVMNRSECWTNFSGDLSGLVLDIERLLFKDLISEIVHAEAVKIKVGRRCRQLFA